ncbi:hypothetical protein DLAC_06258 [Tieghemostelium lacteum]|uniref:BAR domain-containing protein n=1 Tax=Tieghemostelium lacteum TaxID=361077 RepID=A0A151ZEB1_TIELA|nr:hypothetical protein DLAC_06258 [Tieghemostelium lacteum]|eukprot:KYQ92296.1 hypothetical protein DLAC_06258 [Tieghemostelium lacteum]
MDFLKEKLEKTSRQVKEAVGLRKNDPTIMNANEKELVDIGHQIRNDYYNLAAYSDYWANFLQNFQTQWDQLGNAIALYAHNQYTDPTRMDRIAELQKNLQQLLTVIIQNCRVGLADFSQRMKTYDIANLRKTQEELETARLRADRFNYKLSKYSKKSHPKPEKLTTYQEEYNKLKIIYDEAIINYNNQLKMLELKSQEVVFYANQLRDQIAKFFTEGKTYIERFNLEFGDQVFKETLINRLALDNLSMGNLNINDPLPPPSTTLNQIPIVPQQ